MDLSHLGGNTLNEKTTFGAYLLKKRQDLGLTQKELAQRLYVAESTISKWERGLSLT